MARILVIEDDQVTRLIVSTYLKHVGYDVLTACNGLEGVEVFRSCPDLIDNICVVNRDRFQLPSSGWIRIFVGAWDRFRHSSKRALTIRVLA
jgi:hypothetical protein